MDRAMKTAEALATLALITPCLMPCAGARELSPELRFEQRLGAMLPLQASFRDEDGRAVRLDAFFGSRPVIVALTYLECPNLCGTVLTALVTRLRRVELSAGADFEVVVASIDPRDTAAAAARKRRAYAGLYERGGVAGWHFLTGQESSIAELTQAAGFRYARDEQNGQYLHPVGILLATPEGRIARYLLGLDFRERDLKFGLIEASGHRIGSPADRLWLLCHRYDGATGKYGAFAAGAVRASGVGTLLALGGAIAFWLFKELRARRRR